jgi:uncharacterized protein YbbC (DUF1343 family)
MSILRGENKKRFLLGTCLLALSTEANAALQLGIDVPKQTDYAIWRGKRVGAITNQTGVDLGGNRARLLLRKPNSILFTAAVSMLSRRACAVSNLLMFTGSS